MTASAQEIINPIPANKHRIRTNLSPEKSRPVNPNKAVATVKTNRWNVYFFKRIRFWFKAVKVNLTGFCNSKSETNCQLFNIFGFVQRLQRIVSYYMGKHNLGFGFTINY